jgi:hypothetical protein
VQAPEHELPDEQSQDEVEEQESYEEHDSDLQLVVETPSEPQAGVVSTTGVVQAPMQSLPDEHTHEPPVTSAQLEYEEQELVLHLVSETPSEPQSGVVSAGVSSAGVSSAAGAQLPVQ